MALQCMFRHLNCRVPESPSERGPLLRSGLRLSRYPCPRAAWVLRGGSAIKGLTGPAWSPCVLSLPWIPPNTHQMCEAAAGVP